MGEEELYAIATANRVLAADMFAGLTPAQWQTPSLCAGWTVREVAAHLLPLDRFSTWDLARQLIRHRGNLDKMVDAAAREDARRPTTELVDEIRSHAGAEVSVPVLGPHGPMADTAIHLRDAARPLGLDVNPEPAAWRPVLDFLVSKKATRGFVRKGLTDGLRLVATDQDWAHGDGAEVRGTSEALAIALAGRDVVLPELTGPGVDRLG